MLLCVRQTNGLDSGAVLVALAVERGRVDAAHFVALREAHVGRHALAGRHAHQVADDELVDAQALQLAVAYHVDTRVCVVGEHATHQPPGAHVVADGDARRGDDDEQRAHAVEQIDRLVVDERVESERGARGEPEEQANALHKVAERADERKTGTVCVCVCVSGN